MQELLNKSWTADEIALISISLGWALTAIGLGTYWISKDESREHIMIDHMPHIAKEADKKGKESSKRKIDKTGIKKDISATINEFVTTMTMAGADISELYKKFRPESLIACPKTAGSYDSERNRILFDPKSPRASILRGLLSMVAVHTDELFIAEGFERIRYRCPEDTHELYNIGYGLNEGYKDVLLYRYFNVNNTYPELAELALAIEYVVGRSRMEEYFFRGELKEFMDFLNYRRAIPDIQRPALNWILKMDDVFDAIYSGKLTKRLKLNDNYSSLLVEISKLALFWALEIYDGYGEFYPHDDSRLINENHMHANEILKHVSHCLERTRTLTEPGLGSKDLKELKAYKEKTLSNLPKYMQI